MGELILILIVAFIVVGPAELPRVARWIGRAVKTARRAAGELGDAVQAGELKKIAGESGEELKDLKKLQDELKENIKL